MTSIFCPLDDRYADILKDLKYAGEIGFMKFRLEVEIKYFIEITKIKNYILDTSIIDELNNIIKKDLSDFKSIYLEIKEIEKETKHDVKAVEYFLKNTLQKLNLKPSIIEYVHYGLTSQDINTPALSLQLKHFNDVLYKNYNDLIKLLNEKYEDYKDIVLLGKTHGQPAIPTTLGNQYKIVLEALQYQIRLLYNLTKDGIPTKFGGAIGHLNAHYLVDPDIEWHNILSKHINDEYNLNRIKYTTQNLPYSYWSPIFDIYKTINCIISNFCQDIWLMISNGLFHQMISDKQIGSSAMPQKINPINFENAEGNSDLATNMFEFLSRRLIKSRLQRDLTDSTILRNLGMPFGYSLIAIKSLIKGLNQISPNHENIKNELLNEPTIIAEGIQTILRDNGCQEPYEILREITQKNHNISLDEMKGKLFDILNRKNIKLEPEIIDKIATLNQFNYIGKLF
jgi:adenylosuccinate lyase